MPVQKCLLVAWFSCAVLAIPLAAQPTTQQLRKAMDDVNAEYTDQREIVRQLTDDIRRQTGRIEVSADELHQAAAKLDDQLLGLELEEQASRARSNAILMELDKLKAATTQSGEQDPVIAELEKVVAVREKAYGVLVEQHASGAASANEVQEAAAQLAEAKARVAIQRQQDVSTLGGDMVGTLRKELIELNIARQDREVRLKFLEERRQMLETGLSHLGDLQDAQDKKQDLHTHLLDLQRRLDEVAH